MTILLVVLAIAQPAAGLAVLLSVGAFVGEIPDLIAGRTQDWAPALALVAAAYVAQHLLTSLATLVEWHLGQRLNHRLDDEVMRRLLEPAGIAHLEDAQTRDLAAEVADGLGSGRWRPTMVPSALRRVVSGALGLVFAFGAIAWHQWWLGILVAAASIWALYTVIQHSLAMILELISNSGEADARRLEYERDVAVSPATAKEVRLFGFAAWVLDRWQGRLMRMLALDLGKITRIDRGVGVSVTALAIVVGGGFAWAAAQAARGELGLAAATVVVQALLVPLAQFGDGGQAVIDLTLTGRPVAALLRLEKRLETHQEPREAPAPARSPAATSPDIRLENVHFRYPGSENVVLGGVDLYIPAGSSLAVVGMNGAGKTTLVKLLCRFYEPDSGRITADGVDIRDFDRSQWQRHVAAIFQDFARYPVSARDNIEFGNLGSAMDAVEEAARRTGVDTVLADLPQGWDTTLSREFSEGAELSGGQWQRVALSRALLAAGSRAGLLVLDEPAANLDVRAESELNARFLELTKGATTLVISHRFSTVRQADRICVIEDGAVAEVGTHDELLAAGGRYAEMFLLQAERFAS